MLSLFSFFYILFFLSSFLYILGALYEIGVNPGRFEQKQDLLPLLLICWNDKWNGSYIGGILVTPNALEIDTFYVITKSNAAGVQWGRSWADVHL